MKDSLGQELKVGDKVAFVTCNYKGIFSHIDIGNVEKICNTMVWINMTGKQYWQRIKKYEDRWKNRYGNRTLRYPNRIIKIS